MINKVKSWTVPTIMLCLNGFIRSFNPSEPFLTPYLMGPRKNFTGSECVNEIFPVWSYSYVSFLVPVFLVTDLLKYKPIIVFEGLCLIGCWLLLLFGQTVLHMQIMQVFFGMATAAEIGYYSYIYSIVPERRYKQVTSYTRTAVLLGLFLGAVLAQMLVSLVKIDYFYLNVIALANICIAFCISLFLPMPKTTLFFFSKDKASAEERALKLGDNIEKENSGFHDSVDQEVQISLKEPTQKANHWTNVFITLLNDTKVAFSDPLLFRWSVWWALSTCGYMLVVNYVQNLWETIYLSTNYTGNIYNGAVEAVATVLGAAGSFAVGVIKLDWGKWGEIFLGSCSLLKCGLLSLMYFTTNLWLSYTSYIVYIVLYNFVITIAQYQLAVGLNTKRFALVFGVDTFMAVGLNMALTLIVIDDVGFGLNVKTLFVIYSVYFGILAIIFLARAFYSFVCSPAVVDPQL